MVSDDDHNSTEESNESRFEAGNLPGGKTELDLLKERAKLLGVEYRGKIGVDTLRAKIEAHLAGEKEKEEAPAKAKAAAYAFLDPKVQRANKIDKMRKKAMRLHRVRIYNMNPQNADLQGEIITVGNKYLGSVRKFIPFGEATDNGYHVPEIILNHMKTKKFQQFRTVRDRRTGVNKVETRDVPEYNIEYMPMLTQAELKELAEKQSAAERMGG